MLKHLHITNYALISELDIDFPQGFSSLTGETGAGKSIILGALGLVMGQRADINAITEGERKCVIEAVFDLTDDSRELSTFFEDNDIDFEQECTIRRELTSNGKSRAFINDTPVQLSVLKQLSEQLIDIHSQHENLLLGNDRFQLLVVDAVAHNEVVLSDYKRQFKEYESVKQELQHAIQRNNKNREDADYLNYQYTQLQEANLQDDEDILLNNELETLSHVEEIKSALQTTALMLDGEDSSAITSLREASNSMNRISSFLPQASDLAERLESVLIELRDIAQEAENNSDKIEYDPQRIQVVEQRLDLINTLLQKHHKQSVSELIKYRDELCEQLDNINNSDLQIAQLTDMLNSKLCSLKSIADKLTESRIAVCEIVSRDLETNLHRLGMANAKIQIEHTTIDFTDLGQDNLQFKFAANKNQSLRLVSEVASGGEMARLMLCLKSLVSAQQGLSTIIFDEIDTGVSGEVANNMGEMIREIARSRQVLAITHLPQIAAKGLTQFKVYKVDTDTRTETHIIRLTDQERVIEIATLLSGENPSTAALENAKELLNA